MAEKYGIEKLQRVSVAMITVGKDVKGALADKKIDFLEGIKIGQDIISFSDLFQSGEQIVNEVKDLSLEEGEQLINGIANELGELVSPRLREQIQAGWEFVSSGFRFAKLLKPAPAPEGEQSA